MIVFFINVFLLLVVEVRGGNTVQSVYLKTSVTKSSTVSTTGCTLKTYTVRSKLDCVRRCFALTSCVSLTYTALGKKVGSCVCLAPCPVTNNNTTIARGTVCINACGNNALDKASGTQWLNKTCAANTDCPAQQSTCYGPSSTCLCSPGYFYSSSCNTCLPVCDRRNLLPMFQEYKQGCLLMYDDITLYYITFKTCAATCLAYKWCLTFDYNPNTSGCYLSKDTALTSKAFIRHTSNHYQHICF